MLRYISSPEAEPFDSIALDVFARQYAENAAYRRWCDAIGLDPALVRTIEEIPAVPAAVFKELDLVCGTPAVEFRTSGTTGPGQGRHLAPSLDSYRASALAHFRRCVLPEGWKMRALMLAPPPDLAPSSSLSRMLAWVLEECAEPGSGWYVSAGGLERERLAGALLDAQHGGVPVLLAGTTAAFFAFLDYCDDGGLRIALPGGSRLMDTGGMKGCGIEALPSLGEFQAGFYRRVRETLGIPEARCVNEYGMTELFSQFYDAVLVDKDRPRVKIGPSWTRTFVIDPVTLEPAREGELGLLRHLDLANVGSVMAVLTEDLGRASGDGFVLHGRPRGAEARGCGLAFQGLAESA